MYDSCDLQQVVWEPRYPYLGKIMSLEDSHVMDYVERVVHDIIPLFRKGLIETETVTKKASEGNIVIFKGKNLHNDIKCKAEGYGDYVGKLYKVGSLVASQIINEEYYNVKGRRLALLSSQSAYDEFYENSDFRKMMEECSISLRPIMTAKCIIPDPKFVSRRGKACYDGERIEIDIEGQSGVDVLKEAGLLKEKLGKSVKAIHSVIEKNFLKKKCNTFTFEYFERRKETIITTIPIEYKDSTEIFALEEV